MKKRISTMGRRRVLAQNVGVVALALMAAPQLSAQGAPATPAPAPQQVEEEILTLSPFTVDASKEEGYFAQNTLSGSRLRTNVADLASAISVVTKQQLEDTGSVDINDVFRYEIGTEGSTTYTPSTATMRGDGVADAIGGASFGNSNVVSTNATANRVRGLGAPTRALNYYPAISSVPFDSYNTQSVEISRGPNSMLFGMGSPAGIVNQSTASAALNRNTASVNFRLDDRGSKRASFAINRSIIDDVLSVYVAGLYSDQQFERKPSYDTTRRYYGTVTYKPFKKTKITASLESYDNDNRRPNSLTPRDSVSEWRSAGMPVYDNLTKKIKYLSNNTYSPIPYLMSGNAQGAQDVIDWMKAQSWFDASKFTDSTNAKTGMRDVKYGGLSVFSTAMATTKWLSGNTVQNPLWVPGIGFQNSRSIQRISNGNMYDWQQPLLGVNPVSGWGANSGGNVNQVNTGTATNPVFVYSNSTWGDYFQRGYSRSEMHSGPDSFLMGSYRYPGVTDSSIYDWENINISQANFGSAKNTDVNIELEQEILPNLLNFSAGWFRQDFSSLSTYTIAQLNATTLWVDTNMYNMDGTPNPFVGQVFVEDVDPDRFRRKEVVDNYRAMLAFTPDFTKNKGWTKWLGRHQILGLASYMDTNVTSFRERLTYAGGDTDGLHRYHPNPLLNASGAATGWKRPDGSVRRYYYLSSPGDAYGTVTRSSGSWDNADGNGSIGVYDYLTNSYKNVGVTTIWNVHDGATEKNSRKLTSYSGGWTAYLLKDRVVATVGIRRDINRTRSTTNAGMTNAEKWIDGNYQYETIFNRWNEWSRVAGNTKTAGAVVKPFSGWNRISDRAAEGSTLWQFIENFGVSLNKSDNFDAPTTTNVDFFKNRLPKPEGSGKDFGIQFSLPKYKLFARINWFESTNNNMVMPGTAKTAMDRLSGHIDTTAFRSWLETIYVINQGYDPTVTDWRKDFDADASKVSAMQEYIGTNWWNGDWNYYGNLGGTVGATGKAKAKGTEVEINFNPLRNWTVRFTASKIETKYNDTLKEFTAWYNNRMPVWQNAKATDYLLPQYASLASGYDTSGGRHVVLDKFWSATNYNSTITSDSGSGWYNAEDYYASVVTPQYALARDLEGQQAMGQRKYNASLLTSYTFERGRLKGFAIGGAQRWADKAVIGYYGKSSGGSGKLDMSDVTRPIYDKAMWYTDLWISYTTKIMSDKVRMKLQLNVNDVMQDGELKPVAVNFDGSVSGYRIVDPRTYILSATFSF